MSRSAKRRGASVSIGGGMPSSEPSTGLGLSRLSQSEKAWNKTRPQLECFKWRVSGGSAKDMNGWATQTEF